MLVISSEPYHFSDSRVAGRVESVHNSMILLKTHKVLSKTQVPNSNIVQIIHYTNYSIIIFFFKRTVSPRNHVSLNLKDRHFTVKWS